MTKRTRERAAILCQICASNVGIERTYVDRLAGVCRAMFGEYDHDAVELAAEAWCAIDPEDIGVDDPNDPARDAEAESMIRCGWSPRRPCRSHGWSGSVL